MLGQLVGDFSVERASVRFTNKNIMFIKIANMSCLGITKLQIPHTIKLQLELPNDTNDKKKIEFYTR